MAQTVVKFCNKCNEDVAHWDNRQSKRNPKAPDYKCTVCGAGIWDTNKAPAKFDESVSVLQAPKKEIFPKSMVYAYIKDMIVANINKGVPLDELEKTTKEQVKIWVLIGDEVDNWNNGVK